MRWGTLIVTKATRALTHDSKYTVCSVRIVCIMEYRQERTDDPEEGRDERKKRMPVCVLHALEMSSEHVFHRLVYIVSVHG